MITILAGNVILNKYGFRLTETGNKNNMTVNGAGSDFVCQVDDNDTDTLTFDVRIPALCTDADPICGMYERYDRLFNVIRMANLNNGHLQYRWSSDKCVRVWELMGGSLNQKDMQYLYANGSQHVNAVMDTELQLTVRKSEQPLMQLFPVHTPVGITSGADFLTAWGGAVQALLVGPNTTAMQEARSATTLSAFTTLDELTNVGYARLTLTGKQTVPSTLWPVQPIMGLLPRRQHASDRVAVTCADMIWLSIAAGTSIAAVVIADASDNVLAVIPYTNWWFGDVFHTSYIIPDGGMVKFKVNQLGLIVAP